MSPQAVTDDDLSAYIDGALSPEQTAKVEAAMADDAELAARVADYRQQAALLHTLYDPVLDEPVPPRLLSHSRPRGVRIILRVAAVFLIAAVGIGVGWLARGTFDGARQAADGDLAHSAIIAHGVFTPEVRHPVEVTAAEEAHLVKWLSKRLKAPFEAPSLLAHGFSLVGGRLLSGPDGPAAMLMYESEPGQRLTLYIKRRAKKAHATAFRYVHQDDTSAFYWIDEALSYAIVAELEKDRLLAISRAIYDQLDE